MIVQWFQDKGTYLYAVFLKKVRLLELCKKLPLSRGANNNNSRFHSSNQHIEFSWKFVFCYISLKKRRNKWKRLYLLTPWSSVICHHGRNKKNVASHTRGISAGYTVMRNYGMNENFADVNPERDFQPFNDEKNSHLQTKISRSKTMWKR